MKRNRSPRSAVLCALLFASCERGTTAKPTAVPSSAAPPAAAPSVPAPSVAVPSVAAPSVAAPPIELKLRAALELSGEETAQPSGLARYGDRLLTVSDRHDGVVYEIELGQGSAALRPFVSFEPPAGEPTPLDCEGIAVDANGALLIVSEARFRVLRLVLPPASPRLPSSSKAPAGASAPFVARATWVTPSVRALGEAVGLFRVNNAFLEGVTAFADGGLLLAAEREPRGLIQLGPSRGLAGAEAWSLPAPSYPVPAGRPPDFADLTQSGGRVYALERNLHLVVRLERTRQGWREERAWSYAQAENDPRYAYADAKFGLGEGLAITEHEIYVVLDNNGQARAAAPDNRRPLLFIFERPQGD